MAAGLNRVTILGRLGADPETQSTKGDSTVTHFSVAVDESYKDKQDIKVEKVTWFRCEAWNGRGQAIARAVGKGCRIIIEGRMEFRKYEREVEATIGKKTTTVTVAFPDPVLWVEGFKVIDWKEDASYPNEPNF
jgi:single stranded DNA-binding protein